MSSQLPAVSISDELPMMPMMPMMIELRRETAALHARIEAVVPLLRPGFDRAAYATWLARLLRWLAPVEERLGSYAAAWAAWGIDFDARRKVERLARDLRALDVEPDGVGVHAPRESLPGMRSLDEAWGCLYVLEGSTLGGRILLRAVGPRLGLTPAAGLGFLAGYGADNAAMWKSFGAALERFAAAGQCDRASVVRGAAETFTTQMDWIAAGD